MDPIIATSTDMKNHFGRYLEMSMNGTEVIVTKNGKVVARLIPEETHAAFLTDALTGVIKGDYDLDQIKEEYLKGKYEIADR